jgi:hypothetical protein
LEANVLTRQGAPLGNKEELCHMAGFEILGKIKQVEIIAQGSSIRNLKLVQQMHGVGNWRKLKGIAQVRLADATIWAAEIHWYEAHGIGRKELKIKRRWRE